MATFRGRTGKEQKRWSKKGLGLEGSTLEGGGEAMNPPWQDVGALGGRQQPVGAPAVTPQGC